MPVSKDSIKNLLEVLERKYPNAIESHKKISAPSINPNELFKLLFFCWEEIFINCTPIEEKTSGEIKGFQHVRITSKGIRFLENF